MGRLDLGVDGFSQLSGVASGQHRSQKALARFLRRRKFFLIQRGDRHCGPGGRVQRCVLVLGAAGRLVKYHGFRIRRNQHILARLIEMRGHRPACVGDPLQKLVLPGRRSSLIQLHCQQAGAVERRRAAVVASHPASSSGHLQRKRLALCHGLRMVFKRQQAPEVCRVDIRRYAHGAVFPVHGSGGEQDHNFIAVPELYVAPLRSIYGHSVELCRI